MTYLLLFYCILVFHTLAGLQIAPQELEMIAAKVYKNECSSKPENLIHWNEGEAFLSLGIGHFIWYPEGMQGPFEERFLLFVQYCKKHEVALCPCLEPTSSCPWKSRKAFLQNSNSPDVQELRQFLLQTQDVQIDFMDERLKAAFETMTDALTEETANRIKMRFSTLAAKPEGIYALIDYVNFKGEGLKISERYNNQGWGLLQVLEQMDDKKPPLAAFRDAAKAVLKQRVAHSPPERNEARWLQGWLNRCDTYCNASFG